MPMKRQNYFKSHLPWQSEFDHKYACWAVNHRGWAKCKKANKKLAKTREKRTWQGEASRAITSEKEENEMDDVITFIDDDFGNVRVIMIDGDPWSAVMDVCRAIDNEVPFQEISRLYDIGEAVTLEKVSFVSEFGLYSIILGLHKPRAKQFKQWVTHEVIPTMWKIYLKDI